jgi:uncharacterized protein YfdQ (DUF2303 family)
MTQIESSEVIETLIGHGAAMAEPFDHPKGGKAIMAPEGYKIHVMEPIDRPRTHIETAHVFHDAQSFIAYINEFGVLPVKKDVSIVQQAKTKSTQIFANKTALSVWAILDYHYVNAPSYCDHVAQYNLPHSPEWLTWTAIDGKEIPQAAFAEFIEENALDIYEPASADVLEIARSLNVKTSVDFSSAVNIDNGTTQLRWTESQEGKGKGNIDVPRKIKLGLPVFEGDGRVEIYAFLRTRIRDGKLSFIVRMHRRKAIVNEVFDHIVSMIGEGTCIRPFYASY